MDNVCFWFTYFEFSTIKPKSPRGFTGIEFAALHPALIAPLHITGYGLALFLGEGSVLRSLLYDLLRNLWSNLLRNLCYNLRSDIKQLSFYVQILLDDLGML